MPELILNPTFYDFQQYVQLLEEERNFLNDTIINKCLLLGEEIGELAELLKAPSQKLIGHELADILIYSFSIANRLEIDLGSHISSGDAHMTMIDDVLKCYVDNLEIRICQQKLKQQLEEIELEIECFQLLGALVAIAGKIFKGIRKIQKIKISNDYVHVDLKQKIIDMICIVMIIANNFAVDLEQAFRDKEELNKNRTWS